jgi:hypothetical protein
MHSIEQGGGGGSGAGGPASSQTVLVCGEGEGGASASTANSSCLILNNVTGSISVGQDNLGDQSATNSPTSTSTTTNNMSSALEDLAAE